MTMLVGGISILLSLVLSVGVARVGVAITTRARAQTAADAAALAAAAESSLSGGGDPSGQAERFARLNGAKLEGCLCEPGATAAQVRVAIGEASATARAAFDPGRVLPAASTSAGLHPLLQTAVERLVVLSDGGVGITSGARTFEEQSALWEQALRDHGTSERADDWVARPGTSMHEKGLAVDLGGDLALAHRLIDRYGLPLIAPLPNEPWHFELRLP